ncbi:uncharacterized protein LOC130626037 [Hydractinia symbiolongicarpus]|uniref:uncharacterized protein LOC130626037 n=1 Tax=Hydractinia symbiolongicarpus TaxID=13093 RepID=UPI00254B3143|nr:uncharacterized protein LOC130626037 [Hydractinia symbiolongicarpus]
MLLNFFVSTCGHQCCKSGLPVSSSYTPKTKKKNVEVKSSGYNMQAAETPPMYKGSSMVRFCDEMQRRKVVLPNVQPLKKIKVELTLNQNYSPAPPSRTPILTDYKYMPKKLEFGTKEASLNQNGGLLSQVSNFHNIRKGNCTSSYDPQSPWRDAASFSGGFTCHDNEDEIYEFDDDFYKSEGCPLPLLSTNDDDSHKTQLYSAPQPNKTLNMGECKTYSAMRSSTFHNGGVAVKSNNQFIRPNRSFRIDNNSIITKHNSNIYSHQNHLNRSSIGGVGPSDDIDDEIIDVGPSDDIYDDEIEEYVDDDVRVPEPRRYSCKTSQKKLREFASKKNFLFGHSIDVSSDEDDLPKAPIYSESNNDGKHEITYITGTKSQHQPDNMQVKNDMLQSKYSPTCKNNQDEDGRYQTENSVREKQKDVLRNSFMAKHLRRNFDELEHRPDITSYSKRTPLKELANVELRNDVGNNQPSDQYPSMFTVSQKRTWQSSIFSDQADIESYDFFNTGDAGVSMWDKEY